MAKGKSRLPGSKCRRQQPIIELKVTKFGEIVNKEFGEDRILGNGVVDLSFWMNLTDLLINISGLPQSMDEKVFTPVSFAEF